MKAPTSSRKHPTCGSPPPPPYLPAAQAQLGRSPAGCTQEKPGAPRVSRGRGRTRGVVARGVRRWRKGPSSHPCRTPARKASHSRCSPPSPLAHPSAPSLRWAMRRMGRKARRRRRRPRGRCSGTGPPSSRPRTGAGQETEAGPPWAPTPTPTQSWKTGESFPRPHLRAARWPRRASPRPGTSTRPPRTAPGWWPRWRGPGASALCPAAGAPVELVRARPGTTEWSAPGRQPSAGPCQEPQGPHRGRPGLGGSEGAAGRGARRCASQHVWLRGCGNRWPSSTRRRQRFAAFSSRHPQPRGGDDTGAGLTAKPGSGAGPVGAG